MEEKTLLALIFDIQKFCINDGPGIRTTVFFKGCPLNCAWCHNPESKSTLPQIMFMEEKCLGCGRCAAEGVCENFCHKIVPNGDGKGFKHIFDREKCISCGKCAEVCPNNTLEIAGKTATVDEILDEVMKDKIFYENSGGGLTLSGGEPLLQFEFILELVKRAKEKGLHICMETCGLTSRERLAEIANYIDIFLFDWKITDDALHTKYTGVSNVTILKNLEFLDSIGSKIILRCPIIPSVNDTESHFSRIAELAQKLENVIEVNIEPYHPLGESKIKRLGESSLLDGIKIPENSVVEAWISYISEMTSKPVKKA